MTPEDPTIIADAEAHRAKKRRRVERVARAVLATVSPNLNIRYHDAEELQIHVDFAIELAELLVETLDARP